MRRTTTSDFLKCNYYIGRPSKSPARSRFSANFSMLEDSRASNSPVRVDEPHFKVFRKFADASPWTSNRVLEVNIRRLRSFFFSYIIKSLVMLELYARGGGL